MGLTIIGAMRACPAPGYTPGPWLARPRAVARLLCLATAALAGCAVPALPPLPKLPSLPALPHMPLLNPAPVVPPDPLLLGNTTHGARWFFPPGEARGLVLLQPDLGRPCARLNTLAQAWQAQGLAVLCLELPAPGEGAAAQREVQTYPVADALAAAVAEGLPGPQGQVLPQALVVAGHGLGAAFAARVGARLERAAPQRLRGALLLDPVAALGFSDHLRVLSAQGRRPVLAFMAPRSDCNAHHSAAAALAQVRREAAQQPAYVGLLLGEGATHLDAEGHQVDVAGHLACGRPQDGPVARLQALAVQGALDIAQGQAPQPPADMVGLRLLP